MPSSEAADRWANRPAPGEIEGLIVFDGVCVFCARWVGFVLEHDRARRFRFATIQSATGRAIADRYGIDSEAPETNAVILDGRIWFKSGAALKVLGALPATRVLGGLSAVPRRLRDPLYDLIARNRYRLFGRSEQCLVPAREDRARFLT